MSSARRDKRRNNVFFYGGLAVLLILLYGGAAFLQSVNSTSGGRPFEVATDIAVAGIVGAFVGRKFGMGWGVLAVVTIAALALIASRR
jgi:hypothetical protein